MTDTLRIAPRTTRVTLETQAGAQDFTLREMSMPERKAYQEALQRFSQQAAAADLGQYQVALADVLRSILRLDGAGAVTAPDTAWLESLLLYPTAVDRLMDLQADLNTPAGPIGTLFFTAALQRGQTSQEQRPPQAEPAQ